MGCNDVVCRAPRKRSIKTGIGRAGFRISEIGGGSPGSITVNLLNVAAGTGIFLTSPDNDIKKLGTDKTNSGPNEVNLGG